MTCLWKEKYVYTGAIINWLRWNKMSTLAIFLLCMLVRKPFARAELQSSILIYFGKTPIVKCIALNKLHEQGYVSAFKTDAIHKQNLSLNTWRATHSCWLVPRRNKRPYSRRIFSQSVCHCFIPTKNRPPLYFKIAVTITKTQNNTNTKTQEYDAIIDSNSENRWIWAATHLGTPSMVCVELEWCDWAQDISFQSKQTKTAVAKATASFLFFASYPMINRVNTFATIVSKQTCYLPSRTVQPAKLTLKWALVQKWFARQGIAGPNHSL